MFSCPNDTQSQQYSCGKALNYYYNMVMIHVVQRHPLLYGIIWCLYPCLLITPQIQQPLKKHQDLLDENLLFLIFPFCFCIFTLRFIQTYKCFVSLHSPKPHTCDCVQKPDKMNTKSVLNAQVGNHMKCKPVIWALFWILGII